MNKTSNICGVCFKPNHAGLTKCRRCHNELASPAAEEQIKEYYKKKGLPLGVIIFTVLASIGFFMSFPRLMTSAPLSEFSPLDWLQIAGMNIALLVLTAGLLLSREWARKGIIFFQLAVVGFAVLSLFAMQKEKGPAYEYAFKQYAAAQEAEIAEGRREPPPGEAALRQEFRRMTDLSNPGAWVPMLLMMLVMPAIWFAYFSGPVKRYFHYKQLIRADARLGKL